MRQDVDHRLGGPLALIKVEQVLGEKREVESPAHEGAEGPATVDIGSLTQIVDAGPAVVSAVPGQVTHQLPVLAGGDAHRGIVIGGVEYLLAILAIRRSGPVIGEDLF